jgi:rieske iron-sulfur protein
MRGTRSDHQCRCLAVEHSTRRGFLTLMSLFGLELAAAPALADPASERPKEGDFLVAAESEKTSALELKDIPLNKVLLLHLDPTALVGVTQERAAEGVIGYSAICPHAGCEVNVWSAEQQVLECSCHFSHYNPREAAAVIDGPAPRPLAALPLKLVDGKLVVAKPFTGRVGIVPT